MATLTRERIQLDWVELNQRRRELCPGQRWPEEKCAGRLCRPGAVHQPLGAVASGLGGRFEPAQQGEPVARLFAEARRQQRLIPAAPAVE